MKCPNCNASRKPRDGKRCRCGYEFVLDPKRDGLSDAGFLRCVRRASADGTQYFTRNQLITAYLQSTRFGTVKRIVVGIVTAFLVGGVASLVAGELLRGQHVHEHGWLITGALIGILSAIGLARAIADGKPETMRAALTKWKNKGDQEALSHLLEITHLGKGPIQIDDRDLFNYRVVRVLMVDDRLLIDELVFNNWHIDNETLVLARDGYPSCLWVQLPQLLKDVPGIPVFLLHGSGESARQRLRESVPDYVDDDAVVDLGMTEADAVGLRRKHLRSRKECAALPVDVFAVEDLSVMMAEAVAEGRRLSEAGQASRINA